MSIDIIHRYSKKEELLNVITHGFGLILSFISLHFLIYKSLEFNFFWYSASFIIYGLSLIILYSASTFYHLSKNSRTKKRLNIFDHAAIYVLIAGSCSPFLLVGLKSNLGWNMFCFMWFLAVLGIILKLYLTRKFKKLSTIMYLIMGWQVMLLIKPMKISLNDFSLNGIIIGGVFYTIGAILYSIKKIPYNHAIFHVFVLLGSITHFFAIINLK